MNGVSDRYVSVQPYTPCMNVYYATRSTSNVAPCRRRKRKSARGLSLGQAGPGANVWGNTINGRGRHCHVCARPSISLCSACWGLAAARAVRCAALRVAPAGTRRRAGASRARAAALIVARPTQDAPLLGPLLLATHFPDSNVITSTSRASNVITRCLGYIWVSVVNQASFTPFTGVLWPQQLRRSRTAEG